MQEYDNITQLTQNIKTKLETAYSFVKVSGEVSNVKIANRNLFACLRDENSAINITYWGYGNKISKPIVNGSIVNIQGRLTLYAKNGTYNISVNNLEIVDSGQGNIYAQYDILKKKYELLGYYNNKRPMPKIIRCIGIITALEGAALQDILYVLNTNKYTGQVLIKGCNVQGANCPQSVAQSIAELSQNPNIDLILIARGGGAIEDLMGFSSPIVLEALHNTHKITVSAIGHEIDFMLSDFVADIRAPTPSIAAELISSQERDHLVYYSKLKAQSLTIYQTILQNIQTNKYRITLLRARLDRQSPDAILAKSKEYLDKVRNKCSDKLDIYINTIKNTSQHLASKLSQYDIINMLENGYVVLTKNNSIIDSINDIKQGQKLKLRMKDGDLDISIDNICAKS